MAARREFDSLHLHGEGKRQRSKGKKQKAKIKELKFAARVLKFEICLFAF
jgi:hypothetical protein